MPLAAYRTVRSRKEVWGFWSVVESRRDATATAPSTRLPLTGNRAAPVAQWLMRKVMAVSFTEKERQESLDNLNTERENLTKFPHVASIVDLFIEEEKPLEEADALATLLLADKNSEADQSGYLQPKEDLDLITGATGTTAASDSNYCSQWFCAVSEGVHPVELSTTIRARKAGQQPPAAAGDDSNNNEGGVSASTSAARTIFPEDEVLAYLIQLLLGLTHLHRAGITHGDLRASNIQVARDGSLCLTDYGELTRIKARAALAQGIPFSSALRAPEWPPTGMVVATESSDVWQLGTVIYGLLTLHRCQTAASDGSYRLPRVPRAVAAAFSSDIIDLMLQCLAPDPLRRPRVADMWIDQPVRAWAARVMPALRPQSKAALVEILAVAAIPPSMSTLEEAKTVGAIRTAQTSLPATVLKHSTTKAFTAPKHSRSGRSAVTPNRQQTSSSETPCRLPLLKQVPLSDRNYGVARSPSVSSSRSSVDFRSPQKSARSDHRINRSVEQTNLDATPRFEHHAADSASAFGFRRQAATALLGTPRAASPVSRASKPSTPKTVSEAFSRESEQLRQTLLAILTAINTNTRMVGKCCCGELVEKHTFDFTPPTTNALLNETLRGPGNRDSQPTPHRRHICLPQNGVMQRFPSVEAEARDCSPGSKPDRFANRPALARKPQGDIDSPIRFERQSAGSPAVAASRTIRKKSPKRKGRTVINYNNTLNARPSPRPSKPGRIGPPTSVTLRSETLKCDVLRQKITTNNFHNRLPRMGRETIGSAPNNRLPVVARPKIGPALNITQPSRGSVGNRPVIPLFHPQTVLPRAARRCSSAPPMEPTEFFTERRTCSPGRDFPPSPPPPAVGPAMTVSTPRNLKPQQNRASPVRAERSCTRNNENNRNLKNSAVRNMARSNVPSFARNVGKPSGVTATIPPIAIGERCPSM